MSANPGLYEFYIITENDPTGETARGPYTMDEAKFLVKVDEEVITQQHLSSLRQQNPTINNPQDIVSSPGYAKMLRENRNWGIILLVLGAIQLFTSEFQNTWAILLVIVGLGSFYFHSPAIFVTYATTMAWAAISNALSGSGGWLFFSLLQVYFTYSIFRQYLQFRKLFGGSLTDRAARPFPWASFFLGLISLMGVVTALVGVILFVGVTGNEQFPAFLGLIEELAIIFAVLGFSMGLASVLSKYQHKVLSIIGMVASGLVLVIEVGLGLLG